MSMICELFIVPTEAARRVLADPSGIHDLLQSIEASDAVVSLEKSWHGLHYVLTGTAWEGDAPLNILASGGVPVGDEDVGYGPARLLDAPGVQALYAALSEFPEEDFDRNFDLGGLAAAEIYPQIWDEPLNDLKQEYGAYLQELKRHVLRAAESGQALVVTIR